MHKVTFFPTLQAIDKNAKNMLATVRLTVKQAIFISFLSGLFDVLLFGCPTGCSNSMFVSQKR
jgi:hypothetical protein